MENFRYMMSLIMPIYNAESYLWDTLEAISSQTINRDLLEIILIDNGSSDQSLMICNEFQNKFIHLHVIVISQDEDTISSARNLGMSRAKGKYIMFLNDCDYLQKDAVEKLIYFFEEHYCETDVITYPGRNRSASNNKLQSLYMKESGVYDLSKVFYALQLGLNICVKNIDSKEFDIEMLYYSELKFITEILERKMKIGFYNEECYCFNKSKVLKIVEKNEIVIQLFELVKLFEMFFQIPHISKYKMALFVYQLFLEMWKIQNISWAQVDKLIEKIGFLLQKVDINIILFFPDIDEYFKFYLLYLRNTQIMCIGEQNELNLVYRNRVLYHEEKFGVVIQSMKVVNDKLIIKVLIKTPVFMYINGFKLSVMVCNASLGDLREEFFIESSTNVYKSPRGLSREISFKKKIMSFDSVRFEVCIDDFKYDLDY